MLNAVPDIAAPETLGSLVAEGTRRLVTAGVPSPRLDAELLLAEAAGLDRAALIREPEKTLTEAAVASYRESIDRRAAWEPVAYLLGRKDFFGREFRVTRDVLIPRPDTETAVEALLDLLPPEALVLDIGTGSGAIAVTIAAEQASCRVTATDISAAALEAAEQNSMALRTASRVRFLQCDLFPSVTTRFDALVSNPPYIGISEALPPGVAKYEPPLALYGGEDGLDIIRQILGRAPVYLNPGAPVVLEIGDRQGDTVRELAAKLGYGSIEILKDLAGSDRVLRCRVTQPQTAEEPGRG